MGYFTWTDATKAARLNKAGYDYVNKVGYDHPVRLICPDNTVIYEPCYMGYGIFGGKDVYDLVVDWNKDYLKEILESMEVNKYWERYKNIGLMYAEKGEDVVKAFISEKIEKGDYAPMEIREWKRNIGILISCEGDNKKLPYPIKMTKRELKKYDYNKLHPSEQCQ